MARTTWRMVASGALAVLLLAGCSSGDSSGSSSPASKRSTTTAAPTDATKDRLQFRPVIAVELDPSCASAAGSTSTTTADGCDRSSPSSAAEISGLPDPPEGEAYLRSEDGTLIYTVGPVAFGNSSLASAEAARQETWAVNVRVRDRDVDRANDAFNACYDGAPSCPAQSSDGRGSIAIVFDGTVLAAPAVNGADLADDAFTISGDFTEAEAKDLAAAIEP